MTLPALKNRFLNLVAPGLPNEWDLDDALEPLIKLDESVLEQVFAQVPVIWPVSHSLCYDFLRYVQPALEHINPSQLPLLVNETLDQYEKKGLRAAQLFLLGVENTFVHGMEESSSIQLIAVRGKLQPYATGLASKEVELVQAEKIYTDTSNIGLPAMLDLMQSQEDNFLLYKLIVSVQWAFDAIGTFRWENIAREHGGAIRGHALEHAICKSSNPPLLQAFFHHFETIRAWGFLKEELPGLMGEVPRLLPFLLQVPPPDTKVPLLAAMQYGFLFNQWSSPVNSGLQYGRQLALECGVAGSSRKSLAAAESLLLRCPQDRDGEGGWVEPFLFQGHLNFAAVKAVQEKERDTRRELFIDSLAIILRDYQPSGRNGNGEEGGNEPGQQGQDAVVVVGTQAEPAKNEESSSYSLQINNETVELPQELQELTEDIVGDLGEIPEQYVRSAVGRGGAGVAPLQVSLEQEGEELNAPVVYDEWDYRRKGFRKNWCVVREKEVELAQSSFIRQTHEKYRGQIQKIRQQFEMMRTKERFVGRQRDGDDIDFDALVDSIADSRAGLPPSDRLFVRLNRDERDIAVIFLVDMSNSTEGWVGKSIKEALVLMSEAMEVVGDRYGIYGFSGMRRLRCELFPIKGLAEPYTGTVKQRIASIGPREYTRMAPAIRHITTLFGDVDARLRLMLLLSDGKPEDYDGYQGQYAIEDTRHALQEAKSSGVHPFCITIDRHAHDYMAKMYGEKNYIFIDNMRLLPARMPEIYRSLTT